MARREVWAFHTACCEQVVDNSAIQTSRRSRVTNRHVAAAAGLLEITTSDGRTLEVTAVEVGVLGDVAFVTAEGPLPVSANLDGRASPGSEIAAVGYPLGGPFTLARGIVIDRVAGERFGVQGPIVRISAEVHPGTSGARSSIAEGAWPESSTSSRSLPASDWPYRWTPSTLFSKRPAPPPCRPAAANRGPASPTMVSCRWS